MRMNERSVTKFKTRVQAHRMSMDEGRRGAAPIEGGWGAPMWLLA
eukprot:gene24303-34488_t